MKTTGELLQYLEAHLQQSPQDASHVLTCVSRHLEGYRERCEMAQDTSARMALMFSMERLPKSVPRSIDAAHYMFPKGVTASAAPLERDWWDAFVGLAYVFRGTEQGKAWLRSIPTDTRKEWWRLYVCPKETK